MQETIQFPIMPEHLLTIIIVKNGGRNFMVVCFLKNRRFPLEITNGFWHNFLDNKFLENLHI